MQTSIHVKIVKERDLFFLLVKKRWSQWWIVLWTVLLCATEKAFPRQLCNLMCWKKKMMWTLELGFLQLLQNFSDLLGGGTAESQNDMIVWRSNLAEDDVPELCYWAQGHHKHVGPCYTDSFLGGGAPPSSSHPPFLLFLNISKNV